MNETDFFIWDAQDPSILLAYQCDHPIRQAASQVIFRRLQGRRTLSIVEVGPGSGHDYAAFYRPEVLRGRLTYTAIDGSRRAASYLQRKFPEAEILHGTFETLRGRSFDVAWTKDTLEHQPELDPPLRSLLRCAREAVVLAWFLPPHDVSILRFREDERTNYNTWSRGQALEIVREEGFVLSLAQPFREGGPVYLSELWEMVRR